MIHINANLSLCYVMLHAAYKTTMETYCKRLQKYLYYPECCYRHVMYQVIMGQVTGVTCI